jgi:hypothetical protein
MLVLIATLGTAAEIRRTRPATMVEDVGRKIRSFGEGSPTFVATKRPKVHDIWSANSESRNLMLALWFAAFDQCGCSRQCSEIPATEGEADRRTPLAPPHVTGPSKMEAKQ